LYRIITFGVQSSQLLPAYRLQASHVTRFAHSSVYHYHSVLNYLWFMQLSQVLL